MIVSSSFKAGGGGGGGGAGAGVGSAELVLSEWRDHYQKEGTHDHA